jgi:hypothetical protein
MQPASQDPSLPPETSLLQHIYLSDDLGDPSTRDPPGLFENLDPILEHEIGPSYRSIMQDLEIKRRMWLLRNHLKLGTLTLMHPPGE